MSLVPASLGTLRELVEVDFSNNHITAMPETIKKLSFLRVVRLANNELQASC